MITHLAIIAGGKGTRLAASAGEVPKALVSIGGTPILGHQLALAGSAGVKETVVFGGYRADAIRAFVERAAPGDMRVRVVVEDQPKGTAGALLAALGTLPPHFYVLYGDVMAAVDLRRLGRAHLAANADFTAVVHPNDHPQDSDLVETDEDGWVTAIHAKPHGHDRTPGNLVSAALYAVRRDALQPWAHEQGSFDFVRDVMRGLVTRGGRVLAYRSSEYLKDMGTPERRDEVEADWRAGRVRAAVGGSRPAVFLDRDGTLNVEMGHLASADHLQLLPGTPGALRALREAGYLLVVLTNQPVIARGEASERDIAAIHRRLEWELGKAGAYVDRIYVCPHHPDRGFAGERADLKGPCDCRKPAVGLFEQACRDLNIDAGRSWMVGDQTRDIEMARRAGLRSILVRTGAAGTDGAFACTPDHVVDDLLAAAALVPRQEAAAP